VKNFIDSSYTGLNTLPRNAVTEFLKGGLLLIRRALFPVDQSYYALILSGSNWAVPLNNQLSYGAVTSTGFSNPFVAGDQTTWGCRLGTDGCTTTSTTGINVTSAPGSAITTFIGSATGQSAIGPTVFAPSYFSISGAVSPSGAVSMTFNPTGDTGVPTGAPATVGFGQLETWGWLPKMVMQMITGDAFALTHWANMVPFSGPQSAAPPPIPHPPDGSNPWYSWMAGTQWSVVDPTLFGSADPGTFTITGYSGGYLLGSGTGPATNPITFTEMGSITPQGKVLFNTIAGGSSTINSSYGELAASSGQVSISMADYDNTTGQPTGTSTVLRLVSPAPPCGFVGL